MGILTNLLRLSWEEEDRRRNSEINRYAAIAGNESMQPEYRAWAAEELGGMGPPKSKGLKDIGSLISGLIGKGAAAQQAAAVEQRRQAALASTGRPEVQTQITGQPAAPMETTAVPPHLLAGRGELGIIPETPLLIGGQRQQPNIPMTIPGVKPSALLSPDDILAQRINQISREEEQKFKFGLKLKEGQERLATEEQHRRDQQEWNEAQRRHDLYVPQYGDREAWEMAWGSLGRSVPKAAAAERAAPGLTMGSDSELQAFLKGKGRFNPGDENKQFHVFRDPTTRQITDALEGPPVKKPSDTPAGAPADLTWALAVKRDSEEAKRTGRAPKFPPESLDAANRFLKKYDQPSATVIQMGEAKTEAEDIAKGIMEGTQPPTLTGFGMARVGPKVRQILSQKGFNLARAELDWRATEQHFRSLNSVSQLRLREASNFSTESLGLLSNPDNRGDDLIGQLRNFIPRTRFPILNKAALTAAKQGVFGDAAASAARQLDSQVADLQAELGTVYRGGNAPTDMAIGRAMQMLAGEWSENTLRDAVDLSRKNLQLRLNSIRNVGPVGPEGGGLYGAPAPAPPVSTTPINRAAQPAKPSGTKPKTAEEFMATH